MDPQMFAPTAATAPTATDSGNPFQSTGDGSGFPDGQTGQGYQPTQSVPDAAGAPVGEPAGSAQAEPDYRQLYETLRPKVEQFEQILPQYQLQQQAMDELRQLAAHAQQEQQTNHVRQAVMSRREQIYQTAQTMPPEQGMAFIRQNEDQLQAAYEQRIQQIQREGDQRTMQVAEQLAAPLYAQELARRNGLPVEYASLIATLPPRQMDTQVPLLKQQYDQQKAMEAKLSDALKTIDQHNRSQQAGAIAATGAHNAGGVGASPVTGNGNGPAKGSNEHLLALAGSLFGLRQTG